MASGVSLPAGFGPVEIQDDDAQMAGASLPEVPGGSLDNAPASWNVIAAGLDEAYGGTLGERIEDHMATAMPGATVDDEWCREWLGWHELRHELPQNVSQRH